MDIQAWLAAYNYAVTEKLREEITDEVAEMYSQFANEYIQENPPTGSEDDN